jgi:hypothetical protein
VVEQVIAALIAALILHFGDLLVELVIRVS